MNHLLTPADEATLDLTETELANKLGISRKSLWERRQRLNIPRKRTGTRAPRRDSEHG